jgi:uncharacterized NAD(P)/FAD-binding protein YdhS
VVDEVGSPISPSDFLPRRVMGEYLAHSFHEVVAELQRKAMVVIHATRAIDIRRGSNGVERVLLENGEELEVDHVFLTVGHTPNEPLHQSQPAAVPFTFPYPVTARLDPLPPSSKVAVVGMGLVAMDVVWALTVGRGGQLVQDGTRHVYLPSGREPRIQLLSRSGQAYRSKTKLSARSGFVGREQPIAMSERWLASLLARPPGRLDFRKDVLPTLFDEMSARYYVQRALIRHGSSDSAALLASLRRGADDNSLPARLAELSASADGFEPAALFFGQIGHFRSSRAYEDDFRAGIAADVAEASAFHYASPLSAAVEVFRLFRETLRQLIDFGRLTLDSYVDFQREIRTRINRLVAGHPVWRLKQLLAMIDAGVVSVPYGPEARLEPSGAGRVMIGSTRLAEPFEDRVDYVVQGYLEDPCLTKTASPLLRALAEAGRLHEYRYSGTDVGSVDVTPDAYPVGSDGSIQRRLSVFGALTEGTRYFTHYIPSPERGSRAFSEIAKAVQQVLTEDLAIG